MPYVFGPVPSRRLGRSLGVDPIPFKTCNWNCVYCQLGRTSPWATQRREYVPTESLLDEAERTLSELPSEAVDWVTVVGSGEPTLHSGLGRIINRLKEMTRLPVAVITNGSLLYRSDVRAELLAADAVLPTLDAGSPQLYLRLNRPAPELTFARLVGGLMAFRHLYRGQLWVEVMLVRGCNDSRPALEELRRVLERLRPDEVHLNLPVRPSCESWVKPSDSEALQGAAEVLEGLVRVVSSGSSHLDLAGSGRLAESLLAVITRHPLSEEQFIASQGPSRRAEIEAALAQLLEAGQAQVVQRQGQRFWSCAAARYGRGSSN